MAESGVFIGRVLKFSSEETDLITLPNVILYGCFWGEWLLIELLVEASDLGSMTL